MTDNYEIQFAKLYADVLFVALISLVPIISSLVLLGFEPTVFWFTALISVAALLVSFGYR